jgi:hypothetical protein
MEAQFEMLPQDIAAFQRYYAKHRNWFTWVTGRTLMLVGVMLVQMGSVHLVMLHYFRDDPEYRQAADVLVACLFVCWIGVFVLLRINPNVNAKRFQGERKRMTVRIDAEWLHSSNPVVAESRRWRSMEKIGVTRDHAFFFTQPNAAVLLPRRAFPDREGFETFVSAARGFFDAAKSYRDDAYEETA